MTAALPGPLVSTEWLAAHLGEPDLKVVDATFYLPHLQRDARAEFEQAHVPGAVFFDIDAVADHANPLPHMLPDAKAFAGIRNTPVLPVHSYDDPVHAPLGMRAARVYAKIAPAAGHALHMPSHIFFASGMWEQAASSNEAAWKASLDRCRFARTVRTAICGL